MMTTFKPGAGFVLFSMLIMMIIMTLLILSSLQALLLHTKMNQNLKRNHMLLEQLEHVTQEIASSEYRDNCILRDNNPNTVVEWLQQNKGCYYKKDGKKYAYLINDLGVYACLKQRLQGEHYSSHLWLITVVYTKEPEQMLQIRLAKAYTTLLECNVNDERWVNSGIISWRYLSTPA